MAGYGTDVPEERARVKDRISGLIRKFYKPGKVFHMKDLTKFVTDGVGGYVAPNSPYRIMHLLRERGEINYVVKNRSESLYEFTKVD